MPLVSLALPQLVGILVPPIDKCLGYQYCGHLNLHPEEKQRETEIKHSEAKRKREETAEETKQRKDERDALLRVQPLPEYETWWQGAYERELQLHPEKYEGLEGTLKRARCYGGLG